MNELSEIIITIDAREKSQKRDYRMFSDGKEYSWLEYWWQDYKWKHGILWINWELIVMIIAIILLALLWWVL